MCLFQTWSREETDQLFDLCERFDLRFIVIADRFPTDRSVEDLKSRYYSGTSKFMLSLCSEDKTHLAKFSNFYFNVVYMHYMCSRAKNNKLLRVVLSLLPFNIWNKHTISVYNISYPYALETCNLFQLSINTVNKVTNLQWQLAYAPTLVLSLCTM
jgi:hypothetical protein